MKRGEALSFNLNILVYKYFLADKILATLLETKFNADGFIHRKKTRIEDKERDDKYLVPDKYNRFI